MKRNPGQFGLLPTLFGTEENWFCPPAFSMQPESGLSIFEDKNNVYVEAALPGLHPEHVDITFERGVLWIKGEKQDQRKDLKYYRKMSSHYSYQVTVPGDIDEKAEPVATYMHGIMKVAFKKATVAAPKKIAIQKA